MDKPFFYILIRSWKTFDYFENCINSVFNQRYKNYKILYIDDASGYSNKQKKRIQVKLNKHIVIFNRIRKYSVYNGFYMIYNYAKKRNSICLILDGDDWLLDKNTLLYISKLYESREISLTYGSCLFWDGKRYLKNHPLYSSTMNTKYPKKVIKKRLFRLEPFRVSHPMTFKTSLFKMIKQKDFKDESGEWLKYEHDLASFLPMLEMENTKFVFIKKPLYVYNTVSPNLNIKKSPYELAKEELIIRKKDIYDILHGLKSPWFRPLRENDTSSSIPPSSRTRRFP